jgi:hypothetical protein
MVPMIDRQTNDLRASLLQAGHLDHYAQCHLDHYAQVRTGW